MFALRTAALLATASFVLPSALRAQDEPRTATVPVVSPVSAAALLHACYIPKSGTVYRVKSADAPESCVKPDHVEFSWNQQGVQGPQGPAGVVAFPFDTVLAKPADLLTLTQTGAGMAANFQAAANAGVRGRSLTDAGVHGVATIGSADAAGVRAEHATVTGTALEIARGALRVRGAGNNTNTFAFSIDAEAMQSEWWYGNVSSIRRFYIDNPLCNGDPNALVFVTVRRKHDQSYLNMPAIMVDYNASQGKWWIGYEPDIQEYIPGIPWAWRFNVMCIKT